MRFSLAVFPVVFVLLAVGPASSGAAPPPPGDDILLRQPIPVLRGLAAQAQEAGLYLPPDREILSPGLTRLSRRQPERRVRVWAFFTDKGIATRAGYRRALDDLRGSLGERVKKRRRALGPDLGLDFRDLPVARAYRESLRRAGFHLRRTSRWLNAVSLETTADRLPELETFGFVRRVRPVLVRRERPEPRPESAARGGGVLQAAEAPSDSVEALFYGPSYNQLDQIQVLALHRMGYTGAGVRVMMIDTGYRKDHPAVAGLNVVAEWDFINEDGNTQNESGDDSSQHNHGTGTWSVLGGYAPGALIGPAFAAEFVLAKTEDVTQEVHAEEDNYVAALEWGDTLGVEVTSASLGYWTFDDSTGYTLADLDGDTAPITIAVDVAAAKGICCVNAMGNEGPDPSTLGTPADADTVIAVGAVDSLGVLTSFSSRGPTGDGRIKPEICARGRSTYWAQAWTLGYGPASGTSLATPLVGGLAALLKEAHPDWTGYDIREALIQTGTRTSTPDNDYGYGIAQGADALTYGGATPAPPRMSLPFALLEPENGSVLNTVAPVLVWGASEAGAAGDTVTYRVLLAADSLFTAEAVAFAGTDTTLHWPTALQPDSTYWWKVEATDTAGYTRKSMNTHAFHIAATVAVVPGPQEPTPARLLGPAYPNPMRSRTVFSARLPRGARGTLEVFSVRGRRLRRFAVIGDGGEQTVAWDGRDEDGRPAAPGVYFYRLVEAGSGRSFTRKLVRLP